MIFIIILLLLILVIISVLILRKIAFKIFNKKIADFLNKKGTTLEQELQKYIDTQNNNVKIKSVNAYSMFRYKNNEYICIIVKFKIEGQNNWYTGIVSDSGSCTEFKEFNIATFMKHVYLLLQKIYKQPKREIRKEYFIYLPKLDNIYNFNISDDEKIVFNTRLKMFGTERNILLGTYGLLTLTNENMYIYNGAGLWTIDINNNISDFHRDNMCIDISFSEICIFGEGDRICTGFKLYFNNDDINKFEEIMRNIVK